MKPKFCYVCASELTQDQKGYPVCGEHGTLWALRRNSLCGEAFVVREDGKVLLIKRANEPLFGYWALPGGFSNYGEHPKQAAKREAQEETGWEVKLTGKILGAYLDSFPGDPSSEHRVVISYLATPVELAGQMDDETLGCDWFDINHLPDKFVPAQLKRF